MAIPGKGHEPGTEVRRGEIQGWSKGAARRNVEFLQSVQLDTLTGVGDAVTLTLRDLPPTSEDWRYVLDLLLRRIRRMGAVRWHWVVEFQGRKVPHLHMVIYGPESLGHNVVAAWLDLTSTYGSRARSQYVTEIMSINGWFQYLAKHAARGVAHYQRQGMPPGWDTTGRLWGHGGDWQTSEDGVVRMTVPLETFWYIRRINQRRVERDAYLGLQRARHRCKMLVEQLAHAQADNDRFGQEKATKDLRQAQKVRIAAKRRFSHLRKALSWSGVAANDAEKTPERCRKASSRRGMTEWTIEPGLWEKWASLVLDRPGAEVVHLETGEVAFSDSQIPSLLMSQLPAGMRGPAIDRLQALHGQPLTDSVAERTVLRSAWRSWSPELDLGVAEQPWTDLPERVRATEISPNRTKL